MPQPTFLGIDLGTSGCRAQVIDAAGAVLGEARAPLPASQRPAHGASEQHAANWWRATCEVLDAIPADLRRRIRALAIDGTSATLLVCDAGGTPLHPALMYDDARAVDAARRIADAAPVDSPARGPGSALAKLLYLMDGTAQGPARHALHQADWIAAQLSGRLGVSDENNALKLGYDPLGRRWPNWLDSLAVPRRLLPQVLPVGQPIGCVTHRAADRFGLMPDTLVIAGTTDSNAAALAAGISRPGEAVTSLGSTLVIKVLSAVPVASARHGVYSHRIGARWLVGGASNSGGAVLRQYFSNAELVALSAGIDPEQPSGLDYYPLPGRGERFPDPDPRREPRLEPRPDDPAEFLHGLLEGIAAIEAAGYRRLATLGAAFPQRVFSSGGGAANATWQRIRERLLGVPVLPASHTEAAYGTALLARDGCRRHAAG